MVSSTFQESLLRKVQRYVTLKGPRKSSVSSPSSAPRGQSPIRGVCPARSLRCRKWGHRNAAQERRPCHQRWGAGGTRRGRRNLERRRETPGRFRVTVASLLHAFHNPKSISRSSAIRRVKRREKSRQKNYLTPTDSPKPLLSGTAVTPHSQTQGSCLPPPGPVSAFAIVDAICSLRHFLPPRSQDTVNCLLNSYPGSGCRPPHLLNPCSPED